MVEVKIKLVEGGKMPTLGTEGAAAYDCYAREGIFMTSDATIIPLGFCIEIPKGYHAEIYPRSSIGLKTVLRMANSVGIIDSDYRGEVGFIGECKIYGACTHIKAGERIAQMIIKKNEDVNLVQVDELSETERGTNGFGSTGK